MLFKNVVEREDEREAVWKGCSHLPAGRERKPRECERVGRSREQQEERWMQSQGQAGRRAAKKGAEAAKSTLCLLPGSPQRRSPLETA